MRFWQVASLSLIALPAAAAEPPRTEPVTPNKETIEFLVEWRDVDDNTFEMLLENGIKDAEQPPAKKEEKNHE